MVLKRVGDKVLHVVRGDITEARVDAIVNAANEHLVHGGGVAAAISRKGGPAIQEASARAAPVPTGSAAITTAGRLPARKVIHAVGPRGGQPDAARLLESAVLASLELAEKHGLRSVAFPAISTGIFGYPLEDCARILIRVAVDWLRDGSHGVDEIRLVLFDAESFGVFSRMLDEIAPTLPG